MKASEKIQLLLKGVSKSEIAELEAQEQEELENENDDDQTGSGSGEEDDDPEESEDLKELKKQIELMIQENDDLKAQLVEINSKSTQKKEPVKRETSVDVFRELFNNEKTEK